MPVRVSVVIPTYKSAAWLEMTLNSVFRQTYPAENIEVVIADDVSPDDSVAIARRCLAGYPGRSQIIERKRNGGAAANRNSGWRLASGDWIQFLDADDLLAAQKLDLQANLAAQVPEDVAVVYSNWQHFLLEDGEWAASGKINAPFVDDDPLLRILEEFDFGYVGPTLVRRSFLEKVGGFDEKPNLGEDCDLMLRIAMAGGQFREARSDSAAFFYRQSPNSLWRSYIKNIEAMRNLLLGFRTVHQFALSKSSAGRLSDPMRQALAKRYSRFADLYCQHDAESFRLLVGWLKELGFNQPTNLNQRMQLISSLVGYENAIRLRTEVRRLQASPLFEARSRAALSRLRFRNSPRDR